MARSGQIKYPYSIKVLEERLMMEQKHLKLFKKNRDSSPEWGDTNIQSCEYRVGELEKCIGELKLLVESEEQTKP